MNYKLVKLKDFSGTKASIYTIFSEETNKSLFENFVSENINSFKSEILDVIQRLTTIGKKTGAREIHFKFNEGKPGDGICALYDNPNSNLRLYCIRYGSSLIVLGGGGHKPKSIKAFQENEKLTYENHLLRQLSAIITDRIKDKDICYDNDYKDFIGDLTINLEDYE